MRVSEEAVAAVKESLVVSREKRRRIQTMSKDELQGYLVALYREGFSRQAAMGFSTERQDIDYDKIAWEKMWEER